MGLMLIVGIAWMALAVTVAVLIARAIRVADARTVAGTPEGSSASAPEFDAKVLPLTLSRPRTLA